LEWREGGREGGRMRSEQGEMRESLSLLFDRTNIFGERTEERERVDREGERREEEGKEEKEEIHYHHHRYQQQRTPIRRGGDEAAAALFQFLTYCFIELHFLIDFHKVPLRINQTKKAPEASEEAGPRNSLKQ